MYFPWEEKEKGKSNFGYFVFSFWQFCRFCLFFPRLIIGVVRPWSLRTHVANKGGGPMNRGLGTIFKERRRKGENVIKASARPIHLFPPDKRCEEEKNFIAQILFLCFFPHYMEVGILPRFFFKGTSSNIYNRQCKSVISLLTLFHNSERASERVNPRFLFRLKHDVIMARYPAYAKDSDCMRALSLGFVC